MSHALMPSLAVERLRSSRWILVALTMVSLSAVAQETVSRHRISVTNRPLRFEIQDRLVDRVQVGTREVVVGHNVTWTSEVVSYGNLTAHTQEVADQINRTLVAVPRLIEKGNRNHLKSIGAADTRVSITRASQAPSRYDIKRSHTKRTEGGVVVKVTEYIQTVKERRPVYEEKKIADVVAQIELESAPMFDYRSVKIRPAVNYKVSVVVRNVIGDATLKRKFYQARLEGEVRTVVSNLNRGVALTNSEYQSLQNLGFHTKELPIAIRGQHAPWRFVLTRTAGIVIDGLDTGD